eukprot:3589749-Amphidinium_carterae.1
MACVVGARVLMDRMVMVTRRTEEVAAQIWATTCPSSTWAQAPEEMLKRGQGLGTSDIVKHAHLESFSPAPASAHRRDLRRRSVFRGPWCAQLRDPDL